MPVCMQACTALGKLHVLAANLIKNFQRGNAGDSINNTFVKINACDAVTIEDEANSVPTTFLESGLGSFKARPSIWVIDTCWQIYGLRTERLFSLWILPSAVAV